VFSTHFTFSAVFVEIGLIALSEFQATKTKTTCCTQPSTIPVFTSKKRLAKLPFFSRKPSGILLDGSQRPVALSQNNHGFHVEKTAFSKGAEPSFF
jgi:hypothetical protein